ncbi:phosphoribosyltransferase [Candidatus Curtissbacteria bacterium]|nr:phosphoribosyltransferase [Candidatus Curtissbacteria bacterium]
MINDSIFENREQAGKLLAKEVRKLKLNPRKSVIAAIARGGVVVGQAVAKELGITLRVMVVKKLGAPGDPELAIGAVSALGKPYLDYWLIRDLKVSANYLKREVGQKRKEASEREKFLGIKLKSGDFSGKTAVICDDGLATGASAKAAAKEIRDLGAKNVILAVPCGFPAEVEKIKGDFERVIVLRTAADFWAVGQFYRDFSEVTDEQVRNILHGKN